MLHYYGLWKTARLIGKNVRRQKLTISAILHRKPVLTEGRRLSLSVRPPRRSVPSPQWDIINLKGRSSFYFLLTWILSESSSVKSLRRRTSSKVKKIAALFLELFLIFRRDFNLKGVAPLDLMWYNNYWMFCDVFIKLSEKKRLIKYERKRIPPR